MKKSLISSIVTIVILLALATTMWIEQTSIVTVLILFGFVVLLGVVGMMISDRYEKQEKRSQAH